MQGMKIESAETRKLNLRRIADKFGGPSALAAKLGYANPSFLVQMIGPNPSRRVSERTARKMEEQLGLLPFTLDEQSGAAQGGTQAGTAPSPIHADALAKAMDDVAAVCTDLRTTLPTAKFSDVVAFAYREVAERGRPPDREFIKRLILLAKP
jgi:hypothetical protein